MLNQALSQKKDTKFPDVFVIYILLEEEIRHYFSITTRFIFPVELDVPAASLCLDVNQLLSTTILDATLVKLNGIQIWKNHYLHNLERTW